MSEKRNRHNKYLIIGIVFVFIVVIIVGIILWFILNKSETYTSEDIKYGNNSSLSCTSNSSDYAFFKTDSALDHTHKVVALFRDDKLHDLSYEYDGNYETNAGADNAMDVMHADYNIYLGNKGVDSESLSPVFSNNGNKTKVSLYADSGKLNIITAPLFFISDEEFYSLSKYGSKDIKNNYESKGFKCEYYK